jgi:predicted oxidoreductase
VNADSQVLDADCLPITGLYAAGNVAGEKFGVAYYPFFSGMSNGMAVTGGYAAAQHAAK